MVVVANQLTEQFCQQRKHVAIAAIALALLMAVSGGTNAATGSSEGVAASENPWSVNRDEPAEIEIPGVSERPLSAEDGPRVVVSQFELDVDNGLRAALGEERLAAMRALVESRRNSDQQSDGLTIGEMEQIASSLTEYLRNNDFIVAYAFIPTQSVKGGTVTIGVLGGSLGNVVVEGNTVLSDERIKMPFNRLLGRPLEKDDIETAILFVRDYPGVAPAAVLSPGEAVGMTDLTLRVRERRVDSAVSVDNYGTEATGEGRARINVAFNNPLKRGDRLDLNLLKTFSPAEGTYGGGSYETPFGAGGFSAGLLYNTNSFDAEGAGIRLGGESEIGAVFMKQKIIRRRLINWDVFGDLSLKSSKFDAIGGFGDDPEDKLTVLTVGTNFEAVDRFGLLGVNSLNLNYHHGFDDVFGSMDSDGDGKSSRLGGNGELAGGDFDKVTARYQRLQQITPANALIFRAFGQYSDDLLTSLEQMSLGGPYNVRAYPIAEFLMDRGYFGSVDYQFNISSLMDSVSDNWDINLGLFYDYAYGQNEDPLDSERNSVGLGGPGGGVQVEYRWGDGYGVLVRLEAAWRVSGPEQSDGDDPQVWARFELFRR